MLMSFGLLFGGFILGFMTMSIFAAGSYEKGYSDAKGWDRP